MNALCREIRQSPLLWLLVAVPVVFIIRGLKPGAHTLLFCLSVLAGILILMVSVIFAMTLYLLPPHTT